MLSLVTRKLTSNNSTRQVRMRPFSTLPKSWKVLFFGSDNVSLPSLQLLHSSPELIQRLEVVVTERPPKHVKDGAEVARWCQETGIPLNTWSEVAETVKKGFDIGVVVSFGKFIPPQIINSFPSKMINVHPSLLPRYRGAAPILHALRNNDPETGVCIIDLHPTSWDQGHIWSCKKIPIAFEDTLTTLTPKLAALGAEQVINTLKNFEELSLTKLPQGAVPPEEAHQARAPKLQPADFYLRWDSYDNSQIYGHWRSMPKQALTFFESQQLKITTLTIPKEFPRNVKDKEVMFMTRRGVDPPATPLPDEGLGDVEDKEAAGTIVYSKMTKSLYVRCLRGWVSVTDVHVPAMHKPLSCPEFFNNFNIKKIENPKFLSLE